MSAAPVLNTLWTWQCRGAAKAFDRAAREVEKAQGRVLSEVLRGARQSEYGRRLGFDRISQPRDFQRQAPIVSYDDLRPWIEQAAAGTPRALSGERIRLFQPTAGSSGGEKLIPYTPLLQRQFQRAIQAWIWDLHTGAPGVRRGRAYWSISPGAQAPRSTSGGIPIGFDHDVDYLNPLMRRIVSLVLAVPSHVARVRDADDFRYTTLCCLLASDDLALISVWSPTFLTALLAQLEPWLDSMAYDIGRGRLRLPAGAHELDLRIPPNPRRARQLQGIFRTHAESSARLRAIWPRLALISCWCDAASAFYRPQLEALFPGVPLQPKGLMATEGVVSIPRVGREGAALAVTSHFFEFIPCNERGEATDEDRPRLAHELERHDCYQVLLTTGGGLHRYRLGDVVEVVDFLDQCPLVRFLGRAAGATDLVGEKLSEAHVRVVLDGVFAELDLAPRFAMLVPAESAQPGYRLFLECDGVDPQTQVELVWRVEQGLRRNPHYHYAVAIKQLRPIEMTLLHGPAGVGWQVFQQELAARGQKLGDIKPVACDGKSDWPGRFAPWSKSTAAINQTSVSR